MFEATINKEVLELGDSFSFEREIESQICDFKDLPGEGIPSIDFPDTPRNRVLLNHPESFELQRNGEKKFPNFELKADGYLIIRGTLVLQEGFSGYVQGQVGNLSDTQKDKYISDHDLPKNVTFENKSTYTPTDDDYCCPQIQNSDFFAGVSTTTTEKANEGTPYEIEYELTVLQQKHRNSSYYVNKIQGGQVYINSNPVTFSLNSQEEKDYQLTVVSPMLFLWGILNKTLKLNGFYLTENDLSEISDIMSLCLYHNVDIIRGAFTSTRDDARRSSTGTTVPVERLNALARNQFNFDYSKLLPDKTKLKEFIVGLQNLLNIAFVFHRDQTINVIDRDLVITDPAPADIDKYRVGEWEPGEKSDVSLKFIQKHDTNDSLFAEMYEDLSDRLDYFGADLETMTELYAINGSFIGQLRRVKSVGKIYEWQCSVEEKTNDIGELMTAASWRFISLDFQPAFVNYSKEKNVEEISSCFSTLLGQTIPQSIQLGRTILRKNENAPFTPRLLFYKENGSGESTTDNYSLKFTGDKNLIETRWKNWAPFWATREPVTGYFRFPPAVLAGIDVNKKHRTREGEFIIKSMTTRFTQAGVGVTQIEAYKVGSERLDIDNANSKTYYPVTR